MGEIGPYETVEDLPSRPGVSVSTARRSPGEGPAEVVVKTPRSIVGVDSPETAERRRRGLLASAALQEEVSSKGESRRWARIREVSTASSETFVAFDRFDRSASDLARQRRFGLGELRSVALAIIEGLQEIETACGRGHGRLHGGNVLLRQRGNSPTGEIVLTDPSPEPPESSGRDLVALGHLLREVATGHTDLESEAPKNAWNHLGGGARFWQDLVSELVAAEESAHLLDLSTLRDRVRRRAPTAQRRKTPLITALVAVLVAIVGVGGWVFIVRGDRTISTEEAAVLWAEICVEIDGWCAVSGDVDTQLPERLEGELRRRGFEDQALVQHVTRHIHEIRELHKSLLDASPSDDRLELIRYLTVEHKDQILEASSLEDWPKSWMKACGSEDEVKRKIKAVHLAMDKLRSALSGADESVSASHSLRGMAAPDRLPWPDAGPLVAESLERSTPGSYRDAGSESYPSETPDLICIAIVDAAVVEYHMTVLLDHWDGLQDAIGAVERNAKSDPVLALVGSLSPQLTEGRPWGISDVSSAATSVAQAADPVRSVREFVDSDEWQSVEHTLLRTNFSAARAQRGSISADDLGDWLEQAKNHMRIDEPNPLGPLLSQVNAEREKLERLMDGIEAADDEQGLATEIEELISSVERSQSRAWIIANRNSIENDEAAFSRVLEGLRERVTAMEISADDLRKLLDQLDPFAAAPSPIQRQWSTLQTSWIAMLEEGQRVSTYRIFRSSEQVEESLNYLMDRIQRLASADVSTTLSSGGLSDAFDREHIRALEQAIGLVLTDRELGDFELSDVDRERIEGLLEARSIWRDAVVSTVEELERVHEGLHRFEPLTERVAGAESARETLARIRTADGVYSDLGGNETFDNLAALVSELETVEQADREALQARLQNTTASAQSRFAAWNRLGAGWPSNAAEIDELVAFVNSRDTLFEGAGGAADLQRLVSEEGKRRWRESVREMMRAERWDNMKAAFAVAAQLGVDVDIESDAVRFNYALASLEQAAAEDDDEAAQTTLLGVLAQLEPLQLADIESVRSSLRTEMNRSKDGIAEERLTAAGPGSLTGWGGTVADHQAPNPGARLTFDGPPGTGVSLHFILIDESNDRLVYLCSSEVSIAVAREAIAAAGTHELQRQDRGVRLWQLRRSGLVATTTEDELFNWPASTAGQQRFAPEVTAIEPGDRSQMPMQYISYSEAEKLAQALGCRLPTVSEWSMALGAAGSAAGSNLRGTAFLTQRAFADEQRRGDADAPRRNEVLLPYPEEGSFASEWRVQPEPGSVDPLFNQDSSPLFFTEVGGDSGFEHLIGNVAEWVDVQGRHAAIGWSALAPEAPRAQMTAAQRPRGGRGVGTPMSDVGFRLALEIPGTRKPSLAGLLRKWFESPRYLAAGG